MLKIKEKFNNIVIGGSFSGVQISKPMQELTEDEIKLIEETNASLVWHDGELIYEDIEAEINPKVSAVVGAIVKNVKSNK